VATTDDNPSGNDVDEDTQQPVSRGGPPHPIRPRPSGPRLAVGLSSPERLPLPVQAAQFRSRAPEQRLHFNQCSRV
jgi:hypothetical protein